MYTKIALFDVDSVDIDRFFVRPLRLDSEVSVIIIDEPSEHINYLNNGDLNKHPVVCSAWSSIDQFSQILIDHKVSLLLINAHRIIDLMVILAARRCGIQISYIQHGMYIPFMKRSPLFFINKALKTSRYLYYSIQIASNIKSVGVLLNLIGIHVFGTSRNKLAEYPQLFPDQGLVYSDRWLDWHLEYYKFNSVKMHIMGTNDFRQMDLTIPMSNQYISYCYQTLVEDGRISESDMKSFYVSLKEWSELYSKRIIVKTHPRADKRLLSYLNDIGFELHCNNKTIPNTDIVVGHYSTLLSFWGLNGKKVVAISLPGHEINESIASWAHVSDSLPTLSKIKEINIKKCIEWFGSSIDVEEMRDRLLISKNSLE
jgi:hypothetical protein